MESGSEEDLRTMVREFRMSVSNDLTMTHRQMTELGEEVRTRISTSETAILNSVRDLGRDLDRRLEQVERRLGATGASLKRIQGGAR